MKIHIINEIKIDSEILKLEIEKILTCNECGTKFDKTESVVYNFSMKL